MADSGYSGESCIPPRSVLTSKNIHSVARARHETVNERLKKFCALSDVYRHDLSKHHLIFFSVLNITKLLLQSGDVLFQIQDS